MKKSTDNAYIMCDASELLTITSSAPAAKRCSRTRGGTACGKKTTSFIDLQGTAWRTCRHISSPDNHWIVISNHYLWGTFCTSSATARSFRSEIINSWSPCKITVSSGGCNRSAPDRRKPMICWSLFPVAKKRQNGIPSRRFLSTECVKNGSLNQ